MDPSSYIILLLLCYCALYKSEDNRWPGPTRRWENGQRQPYAEADADKTVNNIIILIHVSHYVRREIERERKYINKYEQ